MFPNLSFYPGQAQAQLENDKSTLEAIAAIGSSAALEPMSGLAGIAGTMLPGPQGQGADWVQNVQSQAYQPNDPRALMGIAQGLQVPMEMYEQGTDFLGDTAFNMTGSPTAGSIGKSLPEIAGGALGLRQLMKGVPSPELDDDLVDPSRRAFGTGLLGMAGAAAIAPSLPLKSLLDVPAGAKTAATAVAKAIPSVTPVDKYMHSILSRAPAIMEAIKKGNYDTDPDAPGYIDVELEDGDFWSGPMPSDAVLNNAQVKLDIPREGFPSPDEAYDVFQQHIKDSLHGEDFDYDMFDYTPQSALPNEKASESFATPKERLKNHFDQTNGGTGFMFADSMTPFITEHRIHPDDFPSVVKRLSKENPDNKFLKDMTSLSDDDMVDMAYYGSARSVQDFGDMDEVVQMFGEN